MNKVDTYQALTDQITALISEHGTDWLKTWSSKASGNINSISGKEYQGINVFSLAVSSFANNFESDEWLTYKQAQSKGWQVKKGSKGTHIIYFKINEYENKKTGDIDKVPMIKQYSVFNGDQVEGFIPTKEPATEVETFENCDLVEATIEAHEITIKHGGDTAFFSPQLDFIQMPMKQDFISTDEENSQQTYYSTLLHEVTHWTGHKKRLARDFSGRFGSNAYAFEELVAEIGSVFLCAKMGVKASPSQNNAKYLNNWLEVLKDDKRAIVKAFSLAQKASNYIVEKVAVEA
tara:strand:- start:3928 stop:4800 length:873 start_codon:yes stop_codon:yes gene_type:complete